MSRNEDQTRQELINPKIHAKGWTEDMIRVERTVGSVEITAGRPRRGKGRVDYLLCLPVEAGKSPLPIAILEAKKEGEFPALGIQQAQARLCTFSQRGDQIRRLDFQGVIGLLAGQEQDLVHLHAFQPVRKPKSDDHIALGPACAFQDVVDVARVEVTFTGHLAQRQAAAFMDFGDLGEVGTRVFVQHIYLLVVS